MKEWKRSVSEIMHIYNAQVTAVDTSNTYLQVPNRSTEWVVPKAALLVQELASFAIHRRAEEAIVEALLQFLQHTTYICDPRTGFMYHLMFMCGSSHMRTE
jgi:hypothetical protein